MAKELCKQCGCEIVTIGTLRTCGNPSCPTNANADKQTSERLEKDFGKTKKGKLHG